MTTPTGRLPHFLSSSLSVVAGAFLLFFLLHNNEDPSDPLNQEISQLFHLTVPLKGQVVDSVKTVRRHGYATARWQFALDSSWISYREWIVKNVPDGYRDLQKSESLLRFRGTLFGDVYQVDIRRLSTQSSPRVQVEFVAMPF